MPCVRICGDYMLHYGGVAECDAELLCTLSFASAPEVRGTSLRSSWSSAESPTSHSSRSPGCWPVTAGRQGRFSECHIMSIIGPFSSAEEWELANPETPYKDSLIAGALQLADTPQQAGDRVLFTRPESACTAFRLQNQESAHDCGFFILEQARTEVDFSAGSGSSCRAMQVLRLLQLSPTALRSLAQRSTEASASASLALLIADGRRMLRACLGQHRGRWPLGHNGHTDSAVHGLFLFSGTVKASSASSPKQGEAEEEAAGGDRGLVCGSAPPGSRAPLTALRGSAVAHSAQVQGTGDVEVLLKQDEALLQGLVPSHVLACGPEPTSI